MNDVPTSGEPPAEEPATREISIRRAPKYLPFLIAGAVMGVIAAGIVTVVQPDSQYDKSTVFGFFLVLLIVAGAGLGGLVALIIDWIGGRKTTRALVQETTDPEPDEPSRA